MAPQYWQLFNIFTYFSRHAFERWQSNENLVVLGSKEVPRLPIFSFLIRHPETGKILHHNFVSVLLNDLFGIQARGGCACAGPYAHVSIFYPIMSATLQKTMFSQNYCLGLLLPICTISAGTRTFQMFCKHSSTKKPKNTIKLSRAYLKTLRDIHLLSPSAGYHLSLIYKINELHDMCKIKHSIVRVWTETYTQVGSSC